jgi:D-alanine-D-alanine ligase
VGVIEGFRDQEHYALPPAHTMKSHTHLHPQLHEDAAIEYIVPSRFSHEQKLSLENVARIAHRALGMSHFSRSDLILTPRAVYLLEVNANPGLYRGAPFPLMLDAVGSSVTEFLEHAIWLAQRMR